jgi:ketosteroid isomerase-like protein
MNPLAAADRRAWQMRIVLITGLALAVLALAACGSNGSSASQQALQKQADLLAIDDIEKTWHKASSRHDVDLMMSLWAPDATFNIGTETLTGKAQIRNFFVTKAAPFQPANHWVSDTPAYKIRTTVNGDKGTLYFECHYVDVKTQKVVAVVGADQNVEKIDGKWLITNSAAATPKLSP